MPIEIYFRDLKIDKQKELLKGLNVKSPEELNFDITPLAICHTENDLEEPE